MKISLIENGLDSLEKGYKFLKKYEEVEVGPGKDLNRFLLLKDAILSIQHGIEILFKYLLRARNEVLLYSDLNSKLRSAFVSRRKGEIQELFEAEGVHTVTFKESLARVSDICGIEIPPRLQKKILQVEGWRNSIMHSTVSLPEQQVSGVLGGLMRDLDAFFSKEIGAEYRNGQGRLELERAYNMFLASNPDVNTTKVQVVRRLIDALKVNGVMNVTSPGVFLLEDFQKANSVLEQIQGEDISYGCDAINYNCSGKAEILGVATDGTFRIFTHDNQSYYEAGLAGIVVYVPSLDDDFSPLIFIYSNGLAFQSSNPYVHKVNGIEVQEGLKLVDGTEIWESDTLSTNRQRMYSGEDADDLRGAREIYRFLTPGCVMFLNVQTLQYGRADELMHEPKFQNFHALHQAFQELISECSK